MLEINITDFIIRDDHAEFSGSIAERGANAGRETWGNVLSEAAEKPLLTTADDIEEAKRYFKSFGAWDAEEIAAWTDDEVNALVVQYISGDIREARAAAPGDGIGGINWRRYEKLVEQGTCGGNMGLGVEAGTVWFSLSE